MSCFSNKVGGVLWQTATCAPFFSLRKFWPLAPIFLENILSTRYGHCSSDMTWIIRMLSLPEEKILPILVVFYYTVFTFLAPSCIPPYPSSACKEEEMFIHVPARNGYCSVKLLSLSPIVRRGSHIHNIAELNIQMLKTCSSGSSQTDRERRHLLSSEMPKSSSSWPPDKTVEGNWPEAHAIFASSM